MKIFQNRAAAVCHSLVVEIPVMFVWCCKLVAVFMAILTFN